MAVIVAREEAITIATINNRYRHNMRRNEEYSNVDIDLSIDNHCFVDRDGSYKKIFDDMREAGIFSTRKIRIDSEETALASEIIVAVNKEYFKDMTRDEIIDFFKVAHNALCDFFSVEMSDGTKIDGANFVINSVVHFDEGAPGLHFVVVPCVAKTIKKRRNKKQLDAGAENQILGEVAQLSHSKFWKSEMIEDTNGKKKMYYSFSKLNDVVADAYKYSIYKDIERGNKGSTAKHLHPTQFKEVMAKLNQQAEENIEHIDMKVVAGKCVMDKADFDRLAKVNEDVATQNAYIMDMQAHLDEQETKIKEERRELKIQKVKVERALTDNFEISKKLADAENRAKEYCRRINEQQEEIKRSAEEISFWQNLCCEFASALHRLKKLFYKLFGCETQKEQETIVGEIETVFNEEEYCINSVNKAFDIA